MCMPYNEVNYHYAFEFKISSDSVPAGQKFNVVISNYWKKYESFFGLCTNNELLIISNEENLSKAFTDIIFKIADITIKSNEAFRAANGRIPSPLLEVENRDFLDNLAEKESSKKPLSYYELLMKHIERPDGCLDEVLTETPKIDLIDCQNLMFLSSQICSKAPYIEDVGFFRI